jgi:hypothetical protein
MSSPSVLLSQDFAASLEGINLKWATSGLAAVREVGLVYFKNTTTVTILSRDIASGVLKYNLNSGFDSGQPYSFQIQVVDINGVMAYSNKLILTSPYFMLPPLISSVDGKDSALQVTLATTTNVLTSSDTVEFQLIRSDFEMIPIIKAYSPSLVYQLTSFDSSLLVNGMSYSIACVYQPADSNSRYSAQSDMSPTLSVTPSNTPNGTTPTMVSVGATTLDISVSWARPSDFAEWSESFSILLTLHDLTTSTDTQYVVPGDVVQFTATNLTRGSVYKASIQYSNSAGPGIVTQSVASILPSSVPDALLNSTVTPGNGKVDFAFNVAQFTGQSALLGYKVYKNNVLESTVLAPGMGSSITVTIAGLTNGVSYDFKAIAYNAIGDSVSTSTLSVVPFTDMSIVSVVAAGKTLTITLLPSGHSVQEVTILAIDQDPSSGELSSVLTVIPQNEIPQSTYGQVQVIKTFTGFSSNIAYWAVMTHNSTSGVSQQASNLATA